MHISKHSQHLSLHEPSTDHHFPWAAAVLNMQGGGGLGENAHQLYKAAPSAVRSAMWNLLRCASKAIQTAEDDSRDITQLHETGSHPAQTGDEEKRVPTDGKENADWRLAMMREGEDSCTSQSTDADEGQAHDVSDGGDPLDIHIKASLLWLLGKEGKASEHPPQSLWRRVHVFICWKATGATNDWSNKMVV